MNLTVIDVARLIGRSPRTVRQYLHEGRIPEPPRDGRGFRVWTAEEAIALRKSLSLPPTGGRGRWQR